MTRNEFLEDVTCWSELLDFCNDEYCPVCEDIYDEYDKDSYVDECVRAWANDGWRSLLDMLDGIPCDEADAYRRDYDDDWVPLDNHGDFDEYKDEVLDWADSNEIWDEDEADETSEDDEEDDNDEPIEAEDFSISELLSSCHSDLESTLEAAKATQTKMAEELIAAIHQAQAKMSFSA